MGHGNYIAPAPREGSEVHHVKAGESLVLEYLVMPGESRDLDVFVSLDGPEASLEIRCLYLCGGTEKVRLRTLVHHACPSCHSNQLFKGIAGGSADIRFEGLVCVAPGADGTQAFQENHNIVLTDTAKVETLPQLEIYADDVKCSHGATAGCLDPDALFYMRSRGIPEDEAMVFQMLSFLAPVIPQGKDEEIKEALLSLPS